MFKNTGPRNTDIFRIFRIFQKSKNTSINQPGRKTKSEQIQRLIIMKNYFKNSMVRGPFLFQNEGLVCQKALQTLFCRTLHFLFVDSDV